MIRYLLVLFASVFFAGSTFAQTDTSHLRLSLLTCGTGLQPWETFGHTAIRVTDSVHGTDNVYNYGTFNGYDEDFLMKFTRGKLLYYLSYYSYRQFVLEYSEAGRSVSEQVLDLDGRAKQAVFEYLQWNAREENKYYKYDFFFDNCATRLRDVFPRALGNKFQYGNSLPAGTSLSFREIINQYFYKVHWQRFGVNILLGSRIDQDMSPSEILFLPDYLSRAMADASYKGQKVTGSPTLVVPGDKPREAGPNGPLIVTSILCLLTIAGLLHPRLRKLGRVMSFFFLLLTGLIGCFILVMWFGTDHQSCRDNFNLLWALPTNLIIAFSFSGKKDRYAIVALVFLIASLLLHILNIQRLPLLELAPVLIALVFIYGMIYRKSKLKKQGWKA